MKTKTMLNSLKKSFNLPSPFTPTSNSCNCSQQKAGLVENGVIHKPMIHAMWTVIQEDCDQLWIIFQIRKRSPSHPATGLFPRS
jgi:hypothetical protein